MGRTPARVLLAVLVAASSTVATVGTAAAAPPVTKAPAGIELPFTTFFDMIVDDARGQVFVSGGAGTSSVAVVSADGATMTTIPDIPNAAGMVLSGSTLYVAQEGGKAIDVVDAATLAKGIAISLGDTVIAGDLAMAGGRLWFKRRDCGSSGGLASIDPAAVSPSVTAHEGSTSCPRFATSPNAPNRLVYGETGQSPGNVYVYDVSTGAPVFVKVSGHGDFGEYLQDIDFTPDGTKLLVGEGVPYYLTEADASTLELTGLTYPTGAFSRAIATTGVHPGYVAGARTGSPSVYVYPDGDTTPFEAFTLDPETEPASGALEFSADGGHLYVVAVSHVSDPDIRARLLVLPGPTTAPADVHIRLSRSRVTFGKSIVVTARIVNIPSPRGLMLSIYRIPEGGRKKLVKRAAVDATGRLSVQVKPTKETSYVAEWSGTREGFRAGSSPRATVSVAAVARGRLLGFYARSGNYRVFHRGQPIVFVGSVAPIHPGKRLLFTLQRRTTSGTWKTIGTLWVPMEDNGRAGVNVNPGLRGESFRIGCRFIGDSDHLGDLSPWSYIRVTS